MRTAISSATQRLQNQFNGQSKSPLKGKKQFKNVKSKLLQHYEKPKVVNPEFEEYDRKMQAKLKEIQNDQLKGKITFEDSLKRINKVHE